MNNWNKWVRPVVVLTLVCIVVAGALAVANRITAPIIAQSTRAAQEAARLELLPEATGFKRVQNVQVENVSDISVAENGVGVVVTAKAKGYGGDITVMVAFASDGTIRRIKVIQQAETKGIGSKVADDSSYWARYEGQPARQLVLNEDVDGITGATKSSKALLEAVNTAVQAYHSIG